MLTVIILNSSRYGLQYLMSYGNQGKTTDMTLHSNCLGNGEDPLAKTFDQVLKAGLMFFDERNSRSFCWK